MVMKKCLLDTNFLLIPSQFKLDIFSELCDYELITLDRCIKELEKISRGGSKDAMAAKLAIKLIKGRIKLKKTSEKNTDQALINYAKKYDCAVATNDKKLIKALKSNKIKVIRLRQRKYLSGDI